MRIAVVGASGEVGRMILRYLEELDFRPKSLDLYASAKSAGNTLYYLDKGIEIKELTESSFEAGYDYVFFAAGGGIARSHAPVAGVRSSLVIDNSSAFRKNPDIPLIVPEINGDLLKSYQGIVSNPNCSSIQMLLPLSALDKAYTLKKIVVATYQAVSGSGYGGIQTLLAQRAGAKDKGIYPEIIDLNVIPQIGVFMDSGYSMEEEKMINETHKILRNEEIAISPTTVRVPVIYGHSEAVYAEFERDIELQEAGELLKAAPGVQFHENNYLCPLDIANSNLSHVCRLRYGVDRRSLNFWNLGHNVRIGAAANAVNIMLKHIELNNG
ncbi:MAG: aspartate-semialdehyde dehydrogenase [Candidatus Cloacimonadaceae bacterium]